VEKLKRVLQLAVIVSILAALPACDDAINSYKQNRARQEAEALDKVFSLTVTDLQRTEEEGQPLLNLVFDLNNLSMENLTEFKGKLVLKDADNDLIGTGMVDYKNRLRGGHKLEGLVLTVNSRDNRENYEKTVGFDLTKGNFKLEFVPDVAVFETGVVLRRHDSE
jgi:hypothetical protein